MTVKSGANGHAQLEFPEAGRYLISTRHEVPATDDPKADADAYSAHLMIEAKGLPENYRKAGYH